MFVVNQILDKNPLRIVTLLLYSNKINSLNCEQVFIQLNWNLVQSSVNELYTNVCKTCTCGDRLKAERVLFWLVHISFQSHSFINHFFGFSIIVQRNCTIQVASYEQAIIKRNWKLIHNHQSKKCFSSKHTHWNLSLTDIDLEHMVSYQGMQSGLPPCFLMVNSALSRFLCKTDYLVKPDYSYFFN